MVKNGKSWLGTLGSLVTDPGICFMVAHVLIGAAAGGPALAISIPALTLAATLKTAREREWTKNVKSPLLKNIINGENTSMRLAAVAMIGLAAVSAASGLWTRAAAFALFSAGDFVYNTKFNRKFPLDNVFFTGGSCLTTYIAGGAFFPMALLIGGNALATYNVLKPHGNRNLGRPKLWDALASGISAVLGLASGQAERLLPSLAMIDVTYTYSLMEAKQEGWFGKLKNRFFAKKEKPPETREIVFAKPSGNEPSPYRMLSNDISACCSVKHDFTQSGKSGREESHNAAPPPSEKGMPGPRPDMP